MVILRILLLPFAALYNLITGIRNRLYDLGLKPSARFEIASICVGNLTVGGTGKSPLIEHLIRLLSPHFKLATLSRGYGRKTKGMRIASPPDSALTLGDEPYQFYKKFKNEVVVAVGEDRALAIPHIIDQYPEVSVVLLDDAYQHRSVTPSFIILLSDYNNPFYSDYVLPSGRLRESRNGAGRANVVIVTKCPTEISEEEMMDIEKSIRRYSKTPIFFTAIRYGTPTSLNGSISNNNDIILVSGIANAKPLVAYVKNNFNLLHHLEYQDHYSYTQKDIAAIMNSLKKHPDAIVLTTEKDIVKLEMPELATQISRIPLFYLPIEVEFLKDGEDFDEMVLSLVKHNGDK